MLGGGEDQRLGSQEKMEFGVMIYKLGMPGNPESGRGKTGVPSPSLKSEELGGEETRAWRGGEEVRALNVRSHLMLDLSKA